jgi:hypothetical protein
MRLSARRQFSGYEVAVDLSRPRWIRISLVQYADVADLAKHCHQMELESPCKALPSRGLYEVAARLSQPLRGTAGEKG